jgi:tRNA nucleotidyltransferase (CCA-adding enzyme)
MDVITTHIDAEFDSFASMVAAKKLYPRARLVFPGSQEKNLRDFLRASPHRFGVQRAKSIDLDRVERLIIVDTRRRDRIGVFAGILERKGLKVHIYDHHPPTPSDVSGEFEAIDEVGATVTIMVELLRTKKLVISPEEATLFALGLYEDTGSLTFSSTTPRDLRAGAFLLEQGANLNVVADRIAQELNPEQILVLNDLIRSMERFTVKGVEVAVATARTDHYVGDLSVITHRLKDMHSLNVLFVAARMGDRIHLVARSRIEAVDVGEIAYQFGGGGHPTAASATIRSRRLAELVRRLKKALRSTISPPLQARDMMTAPLRTLDEGMALTEARRLQIRTGLHILPVVSGTAFRGLITRPVSEKAIRHGFGAAPVSDYMASDVQTVAPSAVFSAVEEVILQQGQRFLPVLEGRRIVGAITRTDYLRALRRESARRPPFGYERKLPKRGVRRHDMSELIRDRLPGEIQRLLEVIGKEGDRSGVNVYLVGGVVRDLLLHSRNLDLDVMVEGDGITFARRLGKILGGRVNSYPRFETAVVVLPSGLKLDIATARAEYYESPGALPKVEHGTIKMDLFRRDFSINSLALQLNPKRFGTLHDFFGGQKDLQDGRIRVLHNLSFVEDPTRVFRAIRFEMRLNFRLGEVTRRLIKDAVDKDLLENIVGRRLYGELSQILKEKNPLPALQRMEELGVLRYIHPRMRITHTVLRLFRALAKRMAEVGEEGGESPCLYLAALSECLGSRQREDLVERLAAPMRVRERLPALVREGRRVAKLVDSSLPLTPGEAFDLLSGTPREVVVYAWARTTRRGSVAAIRKYLRESVHLTTFIGGRDLKALGYPPGPLYRKILSALLREKVDGAVMSEEGEKQWVLRAFPLAE